MHDTTLVGLEPSSGEDLRRWGSRFALTVLLLIVVAGGSSLLGVRTQTVSTASHGYSMTLAYPRVARAGLDVTWQLSVRHPGGFGKTLTLALTADQFDIYEHQAFYPSPEAETRNGNELILSFLPPPGDTFVLGFDTYVQPSSQVGRDGTISVRRNGENVATMTYSTWLFP